MANGESDDPASEPPPAAAVEAPQAPAVEQPASNPEFAAFPSKPGTPLISASSKPGTPATRGILERESSMDSFLETLENSPWDNLIDFRMNLDPLQVFLQGVMKSMQANVKRLKGMSSEMSKKVGEQQFKDFQNDTIEHKTKSNAQTQALSERTDSLENNLAEVLQWKKDLEAKMKIQEEEAKASEGALMLRVARLEARLEEVDEGMRKTEAVLEKEPLEQIDKLRSAVNDLGERQDADDNLFEFIKKQSENQQEQMEILQSALKRQKPAEETETEGMKLSAKEITALKEEMSALKDTVESKADLVDVRMEMADLKQDIALMPPPPPPPAAAAASAEPGADGAGGKDGKSAGGQDSSELYSYVSQVATTVGNAQKELHGKIGKDLYNTDRSKDNDRLKKLEETLSGVSEMLSVGHLMTEDEWQLWHTTVNSNSERASLVAELKSQAQNMAMQLNRQEGDLKKSISDVKDSLKECKASATDAKAAKYQVSELEETVSELKAVLANKVSHTDIAELLGGVSAGDGGAAPVEIPANLGDMPADAAAILTDHATKISQLSDMRRQLQTQLDNKGQLDDVKTLQRKMGALLSEVAALRDTMPHKTGEAMNVNVISPVEVKGAAKSEDISKGVEVMRQMLERSNSEFKRDTELLRREVDDMKELSKKTVDQAKSLMDTAVARMDKKMLDKVDKAHIQKIVETMETKMLSSESAVTPISLPSPKEGGDINQAMKDALQQVINQVNTLNSRVGVLQSSSQGAATMVELRATEEELREAKDDLRKGLQEVQHTVNEKVDATELRQVVERTVTLYAPPPPPPSPKIKAEEPQADSAQNARFMLEFDEFRQKVTKDVNLFEAGLELERRRLGGIEETTTKLQDSLARKVSRSQVQEEFEKLQAQCIGLKEECEKLKKCKAETKDMAKFQKTLSEVAGINVADGQAILAGKPAEGWRCLSCDRNPLKLGDEGSNAIPHNGIRPSFSPEPLPSVRSKKSHSARYDPTRSSSPTKADTQLLNMDNGSYNGTFAPTSVKPPPNFHGSRRDLVGEAEMRVMADRMRESLPPVQQFRKSPSP
ncbi:hypothetical protein CYMTET_48518 [Cymbomonas tetramitiformis]|uniref:Uncharacterized protein n=1 Tax=Cymbomonas tetramitiformis TaxID=36881 RepID=A0AAE0BTR7_9CHLO|nr:hypothetical protein CYMTET_48518 [Cymbomonas tetramitiformis]